MGQGGRVVVINGTRMRWKKTYHHTYQMNHFEFPDTIEPGTIVLCYIEWNQHIGKNEKDDSGEVIYEIENVGTFTIGANAKRGFTVYVKYDNLSNLESNYINLGFVHNGYVPFCISGIKDKLISTNSTKGASNWMSNYYDLIGHRLLSEICLPGSHDSGMSSIHSPTAFVNKENTQTQSLEIKDQLNNGIRYFDIRPIIGAGKFHTGHYSKVGIGWQGARGQNIESIIQQLNEFTENKRELIIINLSHSLNTDLGNNKYRRFTQEEYDRLFNQLKDIKNLFITPNEQLNLVDKPLNFFLGNGGSAVIIIFNDDDASLNSFYHRGFYPLNEFPIVDSYANTDKLDKMIDDQLNKLAQNRSNGHNNYFLISWILTLQNIQNVFGPSIEYLADKANSNIFKLISDLNFRSLVKKGFPNIIMEDYVTSENTAIAFAVNLFKNENFFVTIELDGSEEDAKNLNPTSSIENIFLKIYFGIVALIFGLVSSIFFIACYFNKPDFSNYF